jgi:hypothetical protein
MSGWVVDRRVADGEKERPRASARTPSAGFMTVKDALVRGLLLASMHPWINWQGQTLNVVATSLYMLCRRLQACSAYRQRHSQSTLASAETVAKVRTMGLRTESAWRTYLSLKILACMLIFCDIKQVTSTILPEANGISTHLPLSGALACLSVPQLQSRKVV